MTKPLSLDRRQILAGLAASAALGCVPTSSKDGDSDASGTGSGLDDTGGSGTGVTDTGADGDTGTASIATGWLDGTTALLGATYAVDFGDDCTALCEMTLGPCYAETLDRQDISEAVEGLPARMALRVVDDTCSPVAGAVVDVWHCAPNGLYSGQDAQNMCTDGDAEARSTRWFRGTRTTDADGMVVFDTCMPGWYSGRAVHIHLQVRLDGDAAATSQLGFSDALLTDVYSTHPQYSSRGQPDTPTSRDNILGSHIGTHVFSWKQADDGALVLWKTIAVPTDGGRASC